MRSCSNRARSFSVSQGEGDCCADDNPQAKKINTTIKRKRFIYQFLTSLGAYDGRTNYHENQYKRTYRDPNANCDFSAGRKIVPFCLFDLWVGDILCDASFLISDDEVIFVCVRHKAFQFRTVT